MNFKWNGIKPSWPDLRHYPGIYLEGADKNHKKNHLSKIAGLRVEM
jgi:hypothetical protein